MLENVRSKIYRWLRFTEKYTKVDMVYLTKGGAWLTLGNFVAGGSGFLLSVCFANLLPKEVYGQYKYILSIASLFSITTLQGMENAITQAIAKGKEKTFVAGLKTKMKWGMAGAVISLGFSLYYFIHKDVNFSLAYLVVAFFLPFMDSFSLYNSFFNGKKEFKKITILNIISQVISIASMIATVFLTTKLYWIVAAYFIPNTFIRLFFVNRILKKIDQSTACDEQSVKYGKNLSWLSVLGTITKTIDQVIIYNFVNTAALAVYSIAVAPVKELQNIVKSIDPLSLPKLAERSLVEIQKTLLAKIFKLFLIVAVIVVLYIITIPYFYQIFFPKYIDSIRYSQLFSLNLLFYPFILINTALTAHIKQKELFISGLSSSIFYLAILAPLTYLLGLSGVILTYILNNLFNTLVNLYLFKKAKASP